MPQPGVGRADFLDLGDWNAFCSMCGKKRKANTMVRNWQGLYRCPEHDEPRQPQDFARGVPEDLQVPWAQELANNKFASICSLQGRIGVPGYAMPGCAIPGQPIVTGWLITFPPE